MARTGNAGPRFAAPAFPESSLPAPSWQKRLRPQLSSSCGRRKEGPALTYFRVATIIGPGCLTAVFGMGTGMTSQVWAPGGASRPTPEAAVGRGPGLGNEKSRMRESEQAGEVMPRTNRISCGREGQANRLVSTGELNTLPCLHLRPINLVVFQASFGKARLGGGFALRCFQRLSVPHIANLLCR